MKIEFNPLPGHGHLLRETRADTGHTPPKQASLGQDWGKSAPGPICPWILHPIGLIIAGRLNEAEAAAQPHHTSAHAEPTRILPGPLPWRFL